ncbi:hypothetical protein BDW02DRAFT_511104 [Decorospora gaudefroyi]|uniref:Uncharacterized protein n=1 Tax=Decorospora gaudefroyi TaxID=184978 RepID=A0A6A5JWG7_9PLEO|nr:hypothetical protein BDW02DRAFT_511104 [Decorospora gaudefroyi]
MLDENLPTFFLKPSTDKLPHHESYYFTQNGSEPDAQYALHHVDPGANEAKNTYAVALFDSRSPEILYGEVLAKPGWTHATLSQEEIRRNGGVPPPPQPIYPTEFAIQLYNPDSQVVVKQATAKWSSTVSWQFSIPQVTFRTPSNSDLDRTLSDPGADANTPRVNFAWRKEGRLGKDMTCYMTGKSTDPTGKKAKKSKEPDIAVALFSGLREMTIMEPNLYRVEIEDYKGLEVALLLSAAVIRDLFFSDLNEQFHINNANVRKNSNTLRARKGSSPLEGPNFTPPVMTPQPPPAYAAAPSQYPLEKAPLQPARGAGVNAQVPAPSYTANSNTAKRSSLPPLATNQFHPNQPQPQSQFQPPRQPQRPSQQRQQGPRLDPRAQWEIDAETARLKAQVEAEARQQEEAHRKARRRQEEEEERKTHHFLEQERKQKERQQKEQRRKQAEIDKETERLRKQFGDQSNLLRPSPQPQRHSAPLVWQTQRPAPVPAQPPRIQLPQGPYLQAPSLHRPAASQSSFFSNGLPKPAPKAKKSFWGLRTQSEMSGEKLKKKKSSMF